MRIESLKIEWFRGAADPVSMELGSKSLVVYGANASGKSSFIDALEYAIKGGSIRHLAHEYSGKRQERSIPNTHKPAGRVTRLGIKFGQNSEANIQINEDGSNKSSGSMINVISKWDYRRTILRQDEVAEFISDTKGEKYSALLPLLGLEAMEQAADNIRQLTRNVESLSNLSGTRASLNDAKKERNDTFNAAADAEIIAKVEGLHKKYCPDNRPTNGFDQHCAEILKALDTRISQSSNDQQQYATLRTAADLDLTSSIKAIRDANSTLATSVDPLISEKMLVLESAEAFLGKLIAEVDITCPACGQLVSVDKFRTHIQEEMDRLKAIKRILDDRGKALGKLSDDVKLLKSTIQRAEVKSWRASLTSSSDKISACLTYIDQINPNSLRKSCTENDLQGIETKLLPLSAAAASATTESPPEAKQLVEDRKSVQSAGTALRVGTLEAQIDSKQTLIEFLKSLEQCVREEIKLRANSVIANISDDIKDMWKTLHPGEMIEDVQLYLPPDADKAIDIQLNFYGKELNSPRLTLSEGYRNSLGLCIFLAMAKREAANDRPVFLDDVVISLDRDHRGMIVELLKEYFEKRQVVVLTHDREWYAELRHQLPEGEWQFKQLLHYETPEIGIRWSQSQSTFDEARAQLKDRPDSAGNDARKIMDVELPFIAQKLQLELPYQRYEKNDRRMAHEFLDRIINDAKKCFEIRTEANYSIHDEAIDAFRQADNLLQSWGNIASHSFDLVRPEASKLIEACEVSLEKMKCGSCKKKVWYAEVKNQELLQCQCGALRWRYGKA